MSTINIWHLNKAKEVLSPGGFPLSKWSQEKSPGRPQMSGCRISKEKQDALEICCHLSGWRFRTFPGSAQSAILWHGEEH